MIRLLLARQIHEEEDDEDDNGTEAAAEYAEKECGEPTEEGDNSVDKSQFAGQK